MLEPERRAKLESVALDQLAVGINRQQWFAIVVSKDELGDLNLQETTCDFPYADFDQASKMIKKSIDQKMGTAPADPLPLASHLQGPHFPLPDLMNATPEDPSPVQCGDTYLGPTG